MDTESYEFGHKKGFKEALSILARHKMKLDNLCASMQREIDDMKNRLKELEEK